MRIISSFTGILRRLFLTIVVLGIPLVASADDSGKCGDNVTYTYVKSTHTLTKSGRGSMANYSLWDNNEPWYSYRSEIVIVFIEGGVTSIGNYAFISCSGLTSVTIPNSVTSIGEGAFENCSSLTAVTIPNSVVSIGMGAFVGCSSLTSVTIPNSVTSIGEGAFGYCSSLTSITIPNSVTSIGEGAFLNCSRLASITVDTRNTIYDSRERCNAIIKTESNELICGCMITTIPNSVVRIGMGAFLGCSGLTSVTLPNSVTSIGDNAFGGCSGLTSVTIPNSVTSIGGEAFYNCSGLISVISEIENPFYISDFVFTGISKNSILTVPKGTKELYKKVTGWTQYFSKVVEDIISYSLTITATGNGSASYNGTTIRGRTTSFTVNEGTNATITFSPDNGYRIKSVKVNNTTVTVSNNQYTVNNISKNTTVSVEFEAIPPTTYTLSITATGSGYASYGSATIRGGTTSFTVNEGTDATITFSPDKGCQIKTVKVNGRTVSLSNNQYTIGEIRQNTTVVVEFEAAITEMAVGGVSYKVVSLGNRTVRVTSGEYGQMLHVPATVSYQGLTFTVVGIENGVLANATELAAVVWEPQARFTESVSNPNLLLYVNKTEYAPAGIQNVVVDGTAERIVLTEAQNGNDFYCPEEFTARSISLTHQYGMTSGMGVCQGWETIVLPFEVQRIAHESKGTMVPFAAWGGTESEKPFWLYELGSGGWTETTTIRANVPYIISMPNHQNYRDSYRLPGHVTFSAENARVKRTDEAAAVSGGGRTLVPNFRQRAASNEVFALNVVNQFDADTDGAAEGSQFVRRLRQVHPFEAYMTATATTRGDVIPVFEDMAMHNSQCTMHNYEGMIKGEGSIYTLDGRKLDGLPKKKGVYIKNGNKVVVK